MNESGQFWVNRLIWGIKEIAVMIVEALWKNSEEIPERLRVDFVVPIGTDGCAIDQLLTDKTTLAEELFTSRELCRDDSTLSDNCLNSKTMRKTFTDVSFFFAQLAH